MLQAQQAQEQLVNLQNEIDTYKDRLHEVEREVGH